MKLPDYQKEFFKGDLKGLRWRRVWQPTPVFLPGEFHGQMSLAGYGPWGRKESDTTVGLPWWLSSKESACNAGNLGLIPVIPWRRKWQPIPIFLPGNSHGQRSLVGYSP